MSGSTRTRRRACTSGSKAGRWGCSSCSSMSRTSRTPLHALRRVAATGSGLDTLFADVILPRLDPRGRRVPHRGRAARAVPGAPVRRYHRASRLRRAARAAAQRHASAAVRSKEANGCICTRRAGTRCCAGSMRFRKPTGWRSIGEPRSGCTPPACSITQRITRWPRRANETAHAWIAQALYGLATSGRVVAARGWLERLPESIVLGNDRLRLVAAWARALSHEPREAFPLTEPLIGPQVDPALRYEALQVRGAAAHYADDLVAAAEVEPSRSARTIRSERPSYARRTPCCARFSRCRAATPSERAWSSRSTACRRATRGSGTPTITPRSSPA